MSVTEAIEMMLANPEQITFTMLFVGLLIWTMRTNQEREKRYRDREDNLQMVNHDREERYQKTIDDLTIALKGYEEIKQTVQEINIKLK